MTEKKVIPKIKKIAEANNYVTYRVNAGRYQHRGLPDLYLIPRAGDFDKSKVLLPTTAFWLEVKIGSQKLTKQQEIFMSLYTPAIVFRYRENKNNVIEPNEAFQQFYTYLDIEDGDFEQISDFMTALEKIK